MKRFFALLIPTAALAVALLAFGNPDPKSKRGFDDPGPMCFPGINCVR